MAEKPRLGLEPWTILTSYRRGFCQRVSRAVAAFDVGNLDPHVDEIAENVKQNVVLTALIVPPTPDFCRLSRLAVRQRLVVGDTGRKTPGLRIFRQSALLIAVGHQRLRQRIDQLSSLRLSAA